MSGPKAPAKGCDAYLCWAGVVLSIIHSVVEMPDRDCRRSSDAERGSRDFQRNGAGEAEASTVYQGLAMKSETTRDEV